ncbi:MAG: alcohol dehydrogenase [Sulfobacillus benefaciens]|uniref:Alcohol dehydrogenase n=1 Tax=Sulfobacillus benefaciens TaxID=453960 RepID=A0A2T2X575_9FIRM|nr:MAG: alcohol dehydrogenase [Sulfobacillus benefaciens]
MIRRTKSLRLMRSRELEWHEHDLPPLDDHGVLIKTMACAVSIGSEIPMYRGDSLATRSTVYPRQMGYESYGEVMDIGRGVTRIQIGDPVVAFYGQQTYAVCPETQVISVPRNIKPSTALLTILSCDAAKGVLKLRPKASDKVLVSGLGTMGLLTVYFLREYLNVRHVDAMEPDRERSAMGISFGVNVCFCDERSIPSVYDVGFECSARNAAFHVLQASLEPHGRLCVLSDGNVEEFSLHSAFFEKELGIVGSSDGWDYQEHAKWFFEHVPSTPYISDLFQLEIEPSALIGCYQELAAGRIRPIKILVNYQG